MATIDDQRLVRQVDAVGPTALQTVLQAHHLVRVARQIHHRPGRTHTVHRGRRIRHPHASRYHPGHICDATAEPATTGTDRRRAVRTRVVIATVALTLLYVGLLRIFEPNLDGRALVVGVLLMAVAAAVCLNTVTLGTMTPPARHAERAVQGQGNFAGDTRDHSTEQHPRSDDE